MRVAFYVGKTRIFNRLVCWWLNGPISHGELVLSVVDGVAECASSSYMDGGVRVKKMVLNPEHWVLVPVQGDEAYARRWLREHKNDCYDTLGLFGLIARRGPGALDKCWCTEAVAAMLGYDDPWRFDPMTLFVALVRVQTTNDRTI
jgi:hypothetical protein